MSDDQLTTEDFVRDIKVADELRFKHEQEIARLHAVHNAALDRLAEHGHKLPLSDKIAQAKKAFTAANDLQGYGAVSDETVASARELYVSLLAEQNPQPSITTQSS
jgi:uncharacterized protein involved in exopolysaccharide biosynthesis